jgi:hypothetical protein
MNAPCPREIALRIAQRPGQRQQRFNINPDISRWYRRKTLPNRVNACFTAQTTTTGDRSETLRLILF